MSAIALLAALAWISYEFVAVREMQPQPQLNNPFKFSQMLQRMQAMLPSTMVGWIRAFRSPGSEPNSAANIAVGDCSYDYSRAAKLIGGHECHQNCRRDWPLG
ncbi:hypothetical protein ACMFMG_011368 [Clarireedia jacksonii]